MKVLTLSFLFVWSGMFFLSAEIGRSSDDSGAYASIISLIANPKEYSDQQVITSGYLTVGHGKVLLFLHQTDAENGLMENAIPLQLGESDASKELDRFNSRYVRVSGTFLAYPPGKTVVAQGYMKVRRVILTNETF